MQQAVERTSLPQAPLGARARLVTDHGSGYLAEAFEDYLRALGIRHIYRAPIQSVKNAIETSGDRAPDVDLRSERGPKRLFDLFHATMHTLLLFPHGAAHQRYGAGSECLFLVRPD
jgi:transposase InsO family protein